MKTKTFSSSIYIWTEGNPIGASKKVIASLGEMLDQDQYKVVSRRHHRQCPETVGAMCNASIVKMRSPPMR